MIWRGKKGSSMFWYQLSNQSRTNKVNNFSVFYAIPRNLFSIMWRVTNRVSFGVLGEIYNGISVYSFTSHFHAHQLKDLFFRAKINFTGLLHYQTPFLFALWGDGAWSLELQNLFDMLVWLMWTIWTRGMRIEEEVGNDVHGISFLVTEQTENMD